jgi:hypothetical protein
MAFLIRLRKHVVRPCVPAPDLALLVLLALVPLLHYEILVGVSLNSMLSLLTLVTLDKLVSPLLHLISFFSN